ncbi:Aste57867_15445 [Aphanomyces stellatus]|uniref:Aste57867_15445 protein n=1 Tax=Aphanomyces stellatus TaxID=120398 RepID=A0A485L353_9STRA|nr:hypothetical protein As57867_015389 [Aphanomyces stellatus]VFT92247.1 Aste57867_15445 [Aphanomyces stellatus]
MSVAQNMSTSTPMSASSLLVPGGSVGGDLFNKDTFLTSLRDATQNETHVAVAAYSPKGMVNVREKYAQLHDVVGSLSDKITAVLVRQEKDFLAAYRAHMYNVQKELHDTKEKILRNETLENKSEKIKLLEEERDWYRKEALRLDAFTSNMKKDLKHMKEKLESIEEDRDWLEKQLKASKKQNKLLRAELEIRLANLTSMAAAADDERPATSPADDDDPDSAVMLPGLALQTVEREEHFRKQIRQLKRELATSKREVNRLRESNSQHESNEMEAFFLDAIECVKKDIVRRRSHSRESKTRPIPGLRVDPLPECGPDAKDFTSADRIRVIERLLAHDQVLSILYDNLFPAHSKPGVDAPSSISSNHHQHHRDDDATSSSAKKEKQQPPVGSGAAAVAASREMGIVGHHSTLPLDASTLEYLKLKK